MNPNIQNRKEEIEEKYKNLLINYSILQHFFDEAYLDPSNSAIYASFFSLAIELAEKLPLGVQTERAILKLLEARDAAIRSSVHFNLAFNPFAKQRSMVQFDKSMKQYKKLIDEDK